MLQISVAAPCNGSGKTSLLLAILQAFPGTFSAAKFTTIHREEQFCPVGNSGCPCHQLEGDSLLCEDPTVIGQPDTDTGKLVQAGASPTFWAVSRPEGYPGLIEMLRRTRLQEVSRLLTEGNTVLQHLRPDFLLFVVNPYLPRSSWKRDSEELLAKADLVVVNSFLPEALGPNEPPDPSIEKILRTHADRKVQGENATRPDLWKDQRPFTAIRSLLADPPAGTEPTNTKGRT